VKEVLSQNDIKYAYLDITESMLALKQFINYRETRPEFNQTKEKGALGVPCTVVNGGELLIIGDVTPHIETLKAQ